MRLIGYEIKKLLSRQYLLFFVLLLFLINAFNIYSNYDIFLAPQMTLSAGEYCSADIMNYELNEAYFGEITQEKVSNLTAHIEKARTAQLNTGNAPWSDGFFRQPGGDKIAGEAMLKEVERLYNYDERIISPILERNNELQDQAKNAYAVRVCNRIDKVFNGRRLTEYYRVNEYQPLLSYKFSSFCILMISVYAASGLFAGEREAKMLELQKSTSIGAKRLFFIKLAALMLSISILSLLFFAEDLAEFTICRRPSGLNMPLWSINNIIGNYEYSPLNISILAFLILLWLVRTFGVFILAMIGAMFSVLLRRSYLAFLSALLCVAALMCLTMFTEGFFSSVRYMNPVTLLIYPRLVENFVVENVAGLPVFAHELAPVGSAFTLLIIGFASYSFYRRRNNHA